MHHGTHIGPEQYFMHSVQCFHAQHEVFHTQHGMSFKGREPRKVFYNVSMATFASLALTSNPLHM